jgi:ribose transport system ATP-binding protein
MDDVSLAIPTLEMASISKSFSGVAALTDVSLEVLPGEIHALLGENGAGKSTLMNVASGVLQPDAGTITVCGQALSGLNPTQAAALGIAIVFQHPAVMPELTVEENLLVALPKSFFDKSESVEAASRTLLASVGLNVHLKDRVELLTVAQTHLLEVAKALALEPKLLILDEPTAPLGRDSVELLFGLVRSAVAGGTSVVYITHRMAEVRELADRVTVLRDGRVRGTSAVGAITDRELLALIVGRQLDSTFPEKHHANESDGDNFVLDGFTGPGFVDVSVKAVRGEIVGIAGVVGNGQSDVMRALAGLESFTGSVTVQGKKFAGRDLLHKAAFMPSDRQHEGLMLTLSVRENAAVSALVRFKRWFLLSRKKELGRVGDTLHSLSVKALSMDAAVSSLSGGNQQKVVMARALLSEPALLVADEPTQGVDVGARAEIYRILREVSDSGIPVIINSSDAKELEGLCDWVIVMSRGHAVETLSGDDITEERIVEAAVSSTAHAVETDTAILNRATSSSFGRFIRGDYSPAALLAVVIVGLAAYITTQNGNYLGAFNVYSILTLVAALGFIAMGQTVALLIGGIDLSVGPLAGFLVVVASFFINDNKSFGTIVFGLVLMAIFAAVVGLVNGSLIRFLRFTPIAATLTVYIALGGLALLLRPKPGGYISTNVSNIISAQLGPIPVAFIVLVVLTLVVEYFLRQRRWGWRLRATGSSEESARRTGVKINRTVIFAYVTVALFTFLGAIMLAAQIGVGDASQGTTYTLTSITAVVLGGTSLLGGRGSFVGTLFGSILLTQVLNATTFLGLSQFWQYLFQGLLIIGAAVLYSIARSRKKKREALG